MINAIIIIQSKLCSALNYMLRIHIEEESPQGRHSQLQADCEAVESGNAWWRKST